MHLHGNPSTTLFFLEDQLYPGNKFHVQLNKTKYGVPLLPRQTAEQVPFSVDMMKEAMRMLSVKPNSKNAKLMEETISDCERPPLEGEVKHCATSLESMMEFVTSKLGKNVRAMSTEVMGEETKSHFFVAKDGIKKLAEDDQFVPCHRMTYPYLVFWCHKLQKTSAFLVPLEGEDGVRVNTVAVCHKDTSKWDPNHPALQVLKVKPGTVLCHFFPDTDLIWLLK
jgi:hypothetical protein